MKLLHKNPVKWSNNGQQVLGVCIAGSLFKMLEIEVQWQTSTLLIIQTSPIPPLSTMILTLETLP